VCVAVLSYYLRDIRRISDTIRHRKRSPYQASA
jgi:hypothetical protein